MRILHKLDQLGLPYVEGGWPGANPRDTEFFRLATKETLDHAELVAFGMTRRAGEKAEDSATLRDLLDAGTETVTFVGKSWDVHVEKALRTDLDEGVAMVRDTVRHLRAQGRHVFFDAEHFFDGYLGNADFAIRVLEAAAQEGAERLVLCDTNGGTLPSDVARIVGEVRARVDGVPLGIHTHNDAGCAVASALAGVEAGVLQVQGVVNGYGERTGNADIVPIAANLVLKMDADCLPPGAVERLTEVAHYVAEVANVAPDSRQPYAGRFAFTHKAGLHASGVARFSEAYEHVSPDAVGNRRGVVASDLGGAATLKMKAAEFDFAIGDEAVPVVLEQLKERESRGYTFELADASLELLMRRASGWTQPFFEIDSYRVHVEERVGDGEAPARGGHREGPHEGFAPHRVRRGPRARRRVGRRTPQGTHERLPGAPPHRARGLPGAGARRDARDGGGGPRADRFVQRRAVLDHGRGQREHHRGVVGSPHGRLPVRHAASSGDRRALTTIRRGLHRTGPGNMG